MYNVLASCQEAALPEPLFENFSGGFRVKFVREEQEAEPAHVPLNVPLNVPLSERIMKRVSENPGIQRKVLAEQLGVTEKTIGRHISHLIATGRIERRGSKKTGGYWEYPS